MIEELYALAAHRMVGRILWDRRRDRLSFVYDDAWRTDLEGYPLSLSMPRSAVRHEHKVVEAFLWGLLPDHDGVLRSWGRRFQVSPRHAFQLLQHVGEECAGAVQLVRPERGVDWLKSADVGSIQWLSEADIGERMRLLLKDPSIVRTSSDEGQFSLAGAQPKTGFFYDPANQRWGVPSGMIPTTHIFKPATGLFDGYAENEHFCITLARALDIPAAASEVRYFEQTPVIVIERFDRVRMGDTVRRIHQEDLCQALGRRPQAKYQNQGGPSPREIIGVIRDNSTRHEEDEWRFVESLILNWLIGGTDGHAKNYSFLLGPHQVRLAPLYDLSSALPYPSQIAPRHARLAMKIGNQYKLRAIGGREWEKCARELHLDYRLLRDKIVSLAERIPASCDKVLSDLLQHGLKHDVIGRLARELSARAKEVMSGGGV